jgi:hypothetical protein
VASPSVVEVEPGRQGCCAFVVGGEDLVVGPFGLHRSVESLDLAVLPRAVGLDGDVLCADRLDGLGEVA